MGSLLLYREYMNPSANTIIEDLVLQSSNWVPFIDSNFDEGRLNDFFESCSEDNRKTYFKFGISCISCFVQANFTGPKLSKSYVDFFKGSLFQNVDITKILPCGSYEVNVNITHSLLLGTAKLIFKLCVLDTMVNSWWQWRSIIIHQQVLDSLSPELLSEADELHKHFENLQLEEEVEAELLLEQAQLYNVFRQISKVDTHINVARNLLQIEYDLVGKLGKRTKFQQTDIAQLTLSVKTKTASTSVKQEYELPKNVTLQDDVILENIAFDNIEEDSNNLSVLEQKFLLAVLQWTIISQPQDNLYYEEVKPFIDFLLKQSNTWAVRVVVLLTRCKFEAKQTRPVERCLMQCEEMLICFKRENPVPHHRVNDVYAVNVTPIWKTQELLANLLLSLGAVQAALDMFLYIQNWEAVITCYTLLKLRHKAAEIIDQQLNIKPSVKLLCYLGDATDDTTCYEKAWALSNNSSFLAQCHWGMFYYHKREYEQSVSHLKISVDINPMQPNAWLYLGYAALEVENWECAAAAYRHYTSLEPGSFETWNNLAKAYIKLGNKRGAHQALHDALRCNYENWKVWDNVMGVSADIGHFSDVIRSYHRILDLKEKHLDIDVLAVLVRAVCSDISDSDGNPACRALQKTRQLFGRITSIYPSDPSLWELYAGLAPDAFIKTQRLQRALKGFMKAGWEKTQEQSLSVLYACKKLGESALDIEIIASISILHSIKLNLKSVIATLTKLDHDGTKELIIEVDAILQNIMTKIQIGHDEKH